MKESYDFNKGKRGRISAPTPEPPGKEEITIRLDQDVIDHFLARADESGGAVGYQTLINEALRHSTYRRYGLFSNRNNSNTGRPFRS